MRWMVLSVLSVLSVAAVGCGTSLRFLPASPAAGSARAQKAAYQVEMLSLPPTTREYVEVGVLEGQKQWMSLDSVEEVLAKMRSQAARMGCDALVVTGGLVGSGGAGTVLLFKEHGGRSNGYRATCIVWKSPPQSASR